MARSARTDAGTVSRFETGKQAPSIKQLKLLARKLGVLPSDLASALDPVNGPTGAPAKQIPNHG